MLKWLRRNRGELPPESTPLQPADSLSQAQAAIANRDLGAAEQILRTAIEGTEPDAGQPRPHLADLHFGLATVFRLRGDDPSAANHLQLALGAAPEHAAAKTMLGAIHAARGEHEEALRLYKSAIASAPEFVDALNNAGVSTHALGRPQEALEYFERALGFQPSHAGVHYNKAAAHFALGDLPRTELHCREVLVLEPAFTPNAELLGTVLRNSWRLNEALDVLQTALSAHPDALGVRYQAALALMDLDRFVDALAATDEYLARAPGEVSVHLLRGQALESLGRYPQAMEAYLQALALEPDRAMANLRLGALHCQMGRIAEGIALLRRARDLAPELPLAWTSLLFSLNYLDGLDPFELYQEHRRFGELVAKGAGAFASIPHQNMPDPDRKLKIGYVSGDLRSHPVSQFLEPVLEEHDGADFEIYCYQTSPMQDRVTQRLRSLADEWRDISSLSDSAAWQRIREDGIDVLVDLNGHTVHNRLSLFAHKPAPVQATWLGYLNTTGLAEMDYRITDARATPKGRLDECNSERLVRLPHSQWCYRPPLDCPEIGPPPSLDRGYVTFGSFHMPIKVGPQVIELWCELLRELPAARLLIVGRGMRSIAEEFRGRSEARGVAWDRVELREPVPFRDYLDLHNGIDISLDAFPYTGGTTTCHSLWMGVPVVTLAGHTAFSGGGASILHAVGSPDLIASSKKEYLVIATRLAGDTALLDRYRKTLRSQMQSSPFMDVAGFTRSLEEAYRSTWREWCARAKPGI